MEPDGRVLVPAELRRALSLRIGETLVAHADGTRLIFESREAFLRRLQDQFVAVVRRGVSLADELIADRRREVDSESR